MGRAVGAVRGGLSVNAAVLAGWCVIALSAPGCGHNGEVKPPGEGGEAKVDAGVAKEPPGSAAAQAASAPSAPPSLCAAVREGNAAIFKRGAEPSDSRFDSEESRQMAQEMSKALDVCLEGSLGAWVIRQDDVQRGGVVEIRWTLGFIKPGGEATWLEPPEEYDPGFYDACCSPGEETSSIGAFDLNDDGSVELYFSRRWEGAEGGTGTSLHIYRYEAGAIKRVFPEIKGSALEDRDGDGRPDLVLEHDAEERLECPGYAYTQVKAPPLVARGLPGGRFSLDDPAAVALNRAACAEKPKLIVQKGEGARKAFIDQDATAKNVICALAWGEPPEKIVKALEKGCKPYKERDCETAHEALPGECPGLDVLKAWAAPKLP